MTNDQILSDLFEMFEYYRGFSEHYDGDPFSDLNPVLSWKHFLDLRTEYEKINNIDVHKTKEMDDEWRHIKNKYPDPELPKEEYLTLKDFFANQSSWNDS